MKRISVWYYRMVFTFFLWCATYARLRAVIAMDECSGTTETECSLCHAHQLRFDYWSRFARMVEGFLPKALSDFQKSKEGR